MRLFSCRTPELNQAPLPTLSAMVTFAASFLAWKVPFRSF